MIVSAFFILPSAFSQTSVLFPLAQMTGNTNDTTITIRPVVNPIQFHSLVYWLPTSGIQLRTVNGSATTNLIPNDYNVTIAGVPGSWKISVSDTNLTLNAALIGNLNTYTYTNPLPGVIKLIAGNNISLTPPGGQGVVTIDALGGGGSASNAYQLQAANNLVSLSTNVTDLIYTISGVSQTNGYPWGTLYDPAGAAHSATNGYAWGTLYDAAGTARSVTNGYPWSVLYDAAGSASAATNGWPWGTLYDAFGSASAATNGWPWGVLYDSAGAAHAATNGYPWGTLYDAAGSAASATNGYPWGVLYDATGSATAATNGWPWGILYDPAGSASAATNGYPWSALYDAAGAATAATNSLGLPSGLAAFRGTNTFASTNVATVSTPGLVKVDNSTIVVGSDGTISATTGGGGTVTSVGLSMPGEFSVSGSPVIGAGTLSVTRTGTANFLNFGATNLGFVAVDQWQCITNPANHSLAFFNALFGFAPVTVFTNGSLNIGGAMTNNFGFFGNGAGLTNLQGSNVLGVVPINTLQTNQYAYFDGSGGITNVSSTIDGRWWTNIFGTNMVLDTAVLAPISNATNYTATLRSGTVGMQTLYGANTNANISLVGTNLSDVERSVFINNFTSSVNCNLTFTFVAATNQNFSAVVSNGWGAIFNFWNADSFGTNVLVSDAGRYHH
ncbi:MAG TPA: hypothetical protein VN873_02410 [Candidatus Angelobacter sp.]|nr:hypothetical protein [Candidatus Angelobacter sp.]